MSDDEMTHRAIDFARESGHRVHGAEIAQPDGVVVGEQCYCRLPGPLGHAGRVARGGDRARVVPGRRSGPRAGHPELGREQRRLRPMPSFGAPQRLCRAGDIALPGDGRGQQHQRQRTPGIAGPLQLGGSRLQQRCRSGEFAFDQQHVGKQHVTDSPAGLLQLGEVGELLRQRAAPARLRRPSAAT